MNLIMGFVYLTTVILTMEFFLTVWLSWNLVKKLPRVSILPIFMACFVSLIVFVYTWLTAFKVVIVFEPLAWVVFTRSVIMLLMGSPVWILSAVSNVPCVECLMLLEEGVK